MSWREKLPAACNRIQKEITRLYNQKQKCLDHRYATKDDHQETQEDFQQEREIIVENPIPQKKTVWRGFKKLFKKKPREPYC